MDTVWVILVEWGNTLVRSPFNKDENKTMQTYAFVLYYISLTE